MRIAYFSPLGPQMSGIAEYSEELLPHLADHAVIDLFVAGYAPTSPQLLRRFAVFDGREFDSVRESRRYDVCLYHLGNSRFHAYAYRAMSCFPGVAVLHDYVLHHLVVAMTVAEGDP